MVSLHGGFLNTLPMMSIPLGFLCMKRTCEETPLGFSTWVFSACYSRPEARSGVEVLSGEGWYFKSGMVACSLPMFYQKWVTYTFKHIVPVLNCHQTFAMVALLAGLKVLLEAVEV